MSPSSRRMAVKWLGIITITFWLGGTQTADQAERPRSVLVSSSSESGECPQRSHPSDLRGKTLVSLMRPEGKG
ncbi:hypothetical protein TSAR_000084 [Trichomalopsis sarcophagae]|uniref:Uncharacterized protein n=1 Tax=Trichomalopsis sarcophagae TaxID=543379 RepID=A0A232EDH4_9HYME|nr:hypothetical protein TSAR_000084 [Trichomalopsis sarcophagae]